MNKSFALAAVLTAAALTGILSSTPMNVYAFEGGDESETNTEQEIKQKNVGSGESTNNNCALNSIDATGTGQGGAVVDCPVVSGDSRGAP
jgi:hypothetical protein